VFETDKIDDQRDEDADVKSDPKPNAGRHGEEVFMSLEPRQSQIADGARRVRCDRMKRIRPMVTFDPFAQ